MLNHYLLSLIFPRYLLCACTLYCVLEAEVFMARPEETGYDKIFSKSELATVCDFLIFSHGS